MNTIKNKTFQQERELYNLSNARVEDCTFAGELDGESPLKEAHDIVVKNTLFALRYPLWHVTSFTLEDSKFNEEARASIWYGQKGVVKNTTINAIKCFRHCDDITIHDSSITSEEALWMSSNIAINNTKVVGDYPLLHAKDITIKNARFNGKYGLQYMNNVTIDQSLLETKDAFWHSENIIITNSTIDGAYLGWYSKNVTLINCVIKGTQPFCYCENLTLKNCTMIDCDLAFEYSDVQADITGHINSIKNPKSGRIVADSIGEVITSGSILVPEAIIETRK